MLKENLANVEKNIEQACKNAGRSRDEVTLIAVSKTKPVEMLQEITTKTSVISVKIKYRNSAARWSSFHQISAGI